MSKVTTVLNKLGLFTGMRTKIGLHIPRISLIAIQSLPHVGRHAEWPPLKTTVGSRRSTKQEEALTRETADCQ